MQRSTNWFLLFAFAISPIAWCQDVLSIKGLKLYRTSGSVELVSPDESVRKIESKDFGLEIDPGQIVRTGADGAVTLLADDRAAVKLNRNSRLASPARADAGYSLGLLQGKLFLKVHSEKDDKKKPLSEFRLKTPTMILAVKGTSFFATAEEDGGLITGVSEAKLKRNAW